MTRRPVGAAYLELHELSLPREQVARFRRAQHASALEFDECRHVGDVDVAEFSCETCITLCDEGASVRSSFTAQEYEFIFHRLLCKRKYMSAVFNPLCVLALLYTQRVCLIRSRHKSFVEFDEGCHAGDVDVAEVSCETCITLCYEGFNTTKYFGSGVQLKIPRTSVSTYECRF